MRSQQYSDVFTAPVLGIKQLAKAVFSKRVADIHFQREESSNGRIVPFCNHVHRSGVSQPTVHQTDRHSPGRDSGGCCRATECLRNTRPCLCIRGLQCTL